MELNYVLRRCPVHDHYIPQLLPVSSQVPQQATGLPISRDESGATTTCAGLVLASGTTTTCARCSYTSMDHRLPTVSEQVGLRQPHMSASSMPTLFHYPVHHHRHLQPDLPPALLVPNIMTTPILPRFPPTSSSLASGITHNSPAFGYPFTPPVQFPTPPAAANEVATLHSLPPSQHVSPPPLSTSLPSSVTPGPSLQAPEKIQISHSKPSYSYSTLIAMAIKASPHKMATLADICRYVAATFPYYKHSDKSWKRSIRQCLTNNDCFKKAPFAPREIKHSRNNYWVIDPLSKKMFLKGGFCSPRERKHPRQTAEDESTSSQFQVVCIPNENTSIIELVPSIMKKTQAICVLPHHKS